MASSAKPLPDVPHSPSNELTVDSSEHLRKFLDMALLRESEVLKPWAFAIETALSEVTDAMRDDDWLSGIRLAKVRRRKRRSEPEGTVRAIWATEGKRAKDGEGRQAGESQADLEAEARKGNSDVEKNAGSDESHPSEDEQSTVPFPNDVNRRRDALALQQLRDLASSRKLTSSTTPKHLLITVTPPNDSKLSSPIPSPSSNASRVCSFQCGEFALPKPDLFGEDPAGNADIANRVTLYGFKEWETDPVLRPDPMALVGGNFSFMPRPSPEDHEALVKILRTALFIILSILLEQSFLADANVELLFPKPESRVRPLNRMLSLNRPVVASPRSSSPDAKGRFRDSFLSTSIWGVFGKKTAGFLHRNPSLLPTKPASDFSRGGSLDLASPPVSAPPTTPVIPVDEPPPRPRRFSFFSDHRKNPSTSSNPSDDEPLFQTIVRRLQGSREILTTSPDISLPPPVLLLRLAEKEKDNPRRRLSGEERTALSSVYGWEGSEARGSGMTGVKGFMRQQRISVLYSEFIPSLLERSPSTSGDTLTKATTELEVAGPSRVRCGPRACLRTFDFYGEHDSLLGDFIVQTCRAFESKCRVPKCPALRGQHELRWLHNGLRIVADVEKLDADEVKEENIDIWEACTTCDATSDRRKMSDGAYLLSFGKFLELSFYSSRLITLSRKLCSHTTPPPRPWTGDDLPLPRSRFNIIRRFAYKSHVISFTSYPIQDIFELRLPRLQIKRTPEREPFTSTSISSATQTEIAGSDEKKAQWKEIKAWWQLVADHLDKLETHFDDDPSSAYRKSLPRLPSTWEDSDETPTPTATPKPTTTSLSFTMPNSPQTSASQLSNTNDPENMPPRSQSVPLEAHESPVLAEAKSAEERNAEALALLTNMRFAFQRMEQELYTRLQAVPESALNDVRRIFHSAGLGSLRRLTAWEAKHLPKDTKDVLAAERRAIQEPWWWGETYHAVPGSNVIIKDDDWGSIIAFTLSSLDYQDELSDMTHYHRLTSTMSTSPSIPENAPLSSLSGPSGPLSPALSTSSESSFKLFTKAAPLRLDPDNDDVVWAEPETCSAVISRKEHPRDPTALLSLREVLRQRAPIDATLGFPPGLLTGVSRIVSGGSEPTASMYAKPAVELSKQVADGTVMPTEQADTIGKLLHELDGASVTSGPSASSKVTEGSAFVTRNIERRKTASIISRDSQDSSAASSEESGETAAPAGTTTPRGSDVGTEAEMTRTGVGTRAPSPTPTPAHGSTFSSWTNSLSNMMRFMAKGGEHRPETPARGPHHDLLAAHAGHIDERPHIKYDWTVGKRLKYSCTVYYAKQFDLLRRQCGVGDLFLKSMSRSANWSADGGKSKSNFWKTADDRFIIKTLVDAWNVADLQVLIELAPSYFRHMQATMHKACVLAKLLGFYTIEIRNLETGVVQAKADLLVMENLFYAQSVCKTFDLKGIQGRKVKTTNSSTSKTLFDGEWIEGQEKALTLVYPHSKVVLHEGLKSDCEFLAKSNIMDYSLLLGINEAERQISCGLVDMIGSYTFAKTLEYKAKQGFAGKDGKEGVTVMPPHEYQERFIRSLDSYFLACPDKWTKPEGGKATYEYMDLPSVL